MTNHVHLILQLSTDDGLSRAMQRLNSEHAQGVQFRLGRSGHLWQGRFKATTMDEAYLWSALRYVELDPVRAGMVGSAEKWPWSSAAAHLGVGLWPEWLDGRAWSEQSRHAGSAVSAWGGTGRSVVARLRNLSQRGNRASVAS